MNIVISTAWFPVCVGTYLLRAARRAGHDVRTVGPTTGDMMPWEDDLEFAGFGIAPDLPAVKNGDGITMDGRRGLALAEWADLWIDVDGGWMLEVDFKTKRRVGVVTDPHVAKLGWEAMSGRLMQPFVDQRYMMQSPYREAGDGVLPYAYDPEWHKPMDVPQDHDVTNLGACYEERVEITTALRLLGLRVLGPERATIAAAYAKQLCRAPVALVWPLSDDLPARVFEALACGRVVVTKCVPDANILFNCRDADKGLNRALWYSYEDAGPPLGEILRDAAARGVACPDVVKAHTWDARLAQILEGRLDP